MTKLLISVSCIWLALLLCLGLASCTLQVHAENLAEGYSRQTDDAGAVTEDGSRALIDYSFDLFRKTGGEHLNAGKNELLSPLSAAAVLAMIANGAEGETLAQLETLLGADRDALNRYYYAFFGGLSSTDKCKVTYADSVWFREGQINVRPEFLQANADWFGADAYAAPFDASTVKDINTWVKKNTDGMIDSIIDSIEADSVMYLINTLVFDAKWETLYEKNQISDGEFTSSDGIRRTVTYLSSTENKYLSGDGFVGFAKNYDGGKYSFCALLPDEGTEIGEFVSSLSGEKFLDAWQGKTSESVLVRLPEFRFEGGGELNDALKSLGVTDLFAPGIADLSGINTAGGLYCAKIAQKTVIDVSRNGTKAAAVTWGGIKEQGAPMGQHEVYLTRPFVFAIVDNATGVPLFLGAVTRLG